MKLFVNPYRKTKIRQCPDCRAHENSPYEGGNTGCYHCPCGWVECADLADLDENFGPVAQSRAPSS
jgi:hypothetical protein